jgi:hypothetical protein
MKNLHKNLDSTAYSIACLNLQCSAIKQKRSAEAYRNIINPDQSHDLWHYHISELTASFIIKLFRLS